MKFKHGDIVVLRRYNRYSESFAGTKGKVMSIDGPVIYVQLFSKYASHPLPFLEDALDKDTGAPSWIHEKI